MTEDEVVDDIGRQINEMETRRVVPKFIILGENAYLAIKNFCRGITFPTQTDPWPVKWKDCFLVIDPLNKNRSPLVIADPLQEVLMKVRR